MTVLVIRKHLRFAVRRSASLRGAEAGPSEGLLVEISLEGCRISNLDHRAFPLEQLVSIGIDGFESIEGRVRWASEGLVGLRFTPPLHIPMLDRMIRTFRGEADMGAEAEVLHRAYGT